jgi:molecular chaperone DnaJ
VCRGEGRIKTERTVSVDIPKGVSTQNYITMRGQGAAGQRGGPAGDLIVMIEVKGDDQFTRDGDDLWLELPVSFSQAALGATLTVPTPHGDETLEVPSGVQSGTVIKLRGKGMPRLGSTVIGNLNVKIRVWTPKRIGDQQRELFTALAEHEAEGPDQDGASFWGKLKEALGA